MQNNQQLNQDIELVQTIGDLVQTYEEIYVTKMQKVRNSVIGTRYFIEGLAEIYAELKYVYKNELSEIIRRKRTNSKVRFLSKIEKEVIVFLSASDKLSGEINFKVFESFWKYINLHKQSDIVIAGKLGKKYFDQRGIARGYQYFDLPEKILDVSDLKLLVRYLMKYSAVRVFYGKFHNFAVQKEENINLIGETEGMERENSKPIDKFLFEPNLEELLLFFENQIFSSLFQQTVHESYLAQIGSRVMSLESTSSKIEEQLNLLSSHKKKYVKRERNRKQLQSLASMSFWKSF